MLKVRLLGQYEVRMDDQAVEIASRPAQALLAFLILNAGTTQRREKLAALFWPESDETNARSYLRHALWRLRKSLGIDQTKGRDFFRADDITISFDATSSYWLDVDLVESKEAESWGIEDYLTTVTVYRGDLLPGFDAEWVLLERERLRAIFQRKMQALLDHLEESGQWTDVLEWGERWIALGGTPEPAYRSLMKAHYAFGDLSNVAAVYQRCVNALRQDLDVEPSEQTKDLYARLSKGELPLDLLIPGAEKLEAQPAPGEPPYKGLQYFDQDDAELFFGREAMTTKLVSKIHTLLTSGESDNGNRFLAVVGASGSGKSSLLRAGVVATLRQTTSLPDSEPAWEQRVFTPGIHPLEALATSLARTDDPVRGTANLIRDMAVEPSALHLYAQRTRVNSSQGYGRGDNGALILVIDQFEELFTLCRSEAERKAFVENIMTAVEMAGPVCVVIALRSDFYAHCGSYAPLRYALETSQIYLGPMSPDELRSAITGPAEMHGWEFEPGLVDFLLQEIGDEPGGLPLLSHTLLETWQRRSGRRLTFAGYRETGGVRGAIARTAEEVFRGLEPGGQVVAKNIFLRLTELGEDRGDGLLAPDTRRQARLNELSSQKREEPLIGEVLQKLVAARLVTINQDTVEVAHEVLIREWPTLRQWLDEDRETLQIHRHLTTSAQAWEELGEDPGELYRGVRLAQAGEWASLHKGEMTLLERNFLEASQERVRLQEAELEAQRRREIEAAQKLAQVEKQRAEVQTRANRRLRWFAVGLVFLLIVAIGSGLFATRQTDQARAQTRLATARELASAALTNLEVDPERSLLLALQAVEGTLDVDQFALPEAEDALHKAVEAMRVKFTVPSTGGVAFSPDNKLIATTDLDGTAKIRDATTGEELLTLAGHNGDVMNLAFSPDGSRLVTTSLDHTAKIWDTTTGEELFTLTGHTDGLLTPAFSPDGSLVATTSFDCTARIWDAHTGEELQVLPHLGITSGPEFSPDGRLLGVPDHTESDLCAGGQAPEGGITPARVWDVKSGEEVLTITGHFDGVNEVDFSPDGTRLLTVSSDTTAKVWDVKTGEQLLTLFHSAWVFSGDFSPDGKLIATGVQDGTARVWDASTGQELFKLAGHTAGIGNIAFSPDGKSLITGSGDGTAKVWDITPQGSHEWVTYAGHDDLVFHLTYSPDGSRVASSSWDGTAKVWDANTGEEILALDRRNGSRAVNPSNSGGRDDRLAGIAYSPDGSRLATSGYDGTAQIWDATSGQQLLSLEPESGKKIFDIAFSPDGQVIATAGEDRAAQLWQADTGERIAVLAGHNADIFGIAFSPDGTRLATASDDGTAKIWDVASGNDLITLSGHADQVKSVAYSPDGQRIATGSWDTTIKIWDATSGEALYTLPGHTAGVWRVKFSPDGKRLASLGFDNTARVWDLEAAQRGEANPVLNIFTGDFGPGIAFNPNGRRLAIPTQEGTVRIYVLPVGELVDLARSRLTRTWTLEECHQYLHMDACPADPRERGR